MLPDRLPVAMTDSEGSGGSRRSDDEAKRQLRLLGVGFVVSGLVTVGLADAADPGGILVPLLALLGITALVLEWTQGVTNGVSFGLLTGAVVVWLWPTLGAGDAGYDSLGTMVVAVGLVNVLFARVGVYFKRFGERLAGGSPGSDPADGGEEETDE